MVWLTGDGHLGMAQHSRADHKTAPNLLHDCSGGRGGDDHFDGDVPAWVEGLALSRNECDALGGQGIEQPTAHHDQPTQPSVEGGTKRLGLAALLGLGGTKQQAAQQGRRRLAAGGVGKGRVSSANGLIKPVKGGQQRTHHSEAGLNHGSLALFAGGDEFSFAACLAGLKGRQSRRQMLGLGFSEGVSFELFATSTADLLLKGDDRGLKRIDLGC
jgi:hypothetical protein